MDVAKEDEGKIEIVRLSFRGGGEKEGYRRLKNVLSDKGWEGKVRTVTLESQIAKLGWSRRIKVDVMFGKLPLPMVMGMCGWISPVEALA
jgi:hypothetical protein